METIFFYSIRSALPSEILEDIVTNNPSNTTAPYQITFSSNPLPLVTLPYATNTSASTSVTITSFPAATVAATGQQYIVYALDTSVNQPSLNDLKNAQSGIFSGSFTQAAFNALPKSAPTTASTNVTVQGLVVTKNYKFAVIALSSVGYIFGGFIDATTTLAGIRASAQAEYVSSSFASAHFKILLFRTWSRRFRRRKFTLLTRFLF